MDYVNKIEELEEQMLLLGKQLAEKDGEIRHLQEENFLLQRKILDSNGNSHSICAFAGNNPVTDLILHLSDVMENLKLAKELVDYIKKTSHSNPSTLQSHDPATEQAATPVLVGEKDPYLRISLI